MQDSYMTLHRDDIINYVGVRDTFMIVWDLYLCRKKIHIMLHCPLLVPLSSRRWVTSVEPSRNSVRLSWMLSMHLPRDLFWTFYLPALIDTIQWIEPGNPLKWGHPGTYEGHLDVSDIVELYPLKQGHPSIKDTWIAVLHPVKRGHPGIKDTWICMS